MGTGSGCHRGPSRWPALHRYLAIPYVLAGVGSCFEFSDLKGVGDSPPLRHSGASPTRVARPRAVRPAWRIAPNSCSSPSPAGYLLATSPRYNPTTAGQNDARSPHAAPPSQPRDGLWHPALRSGACPHTSQNKNPGPARVRAPPPWREYYQISADPGAPYPGRQIAFRRERIAYTCLAVLVAKIPRMLSDGCAEVYGRHDGIVPRATSLPGGPSAKRPGNLRHGGPPIAPPAPAYHPGPERLGVQ